MESPEIDWELERRGQLVLQSAAEIFGDERFASGWYEHIPMPTIHIYAINPAQSEIAELDVQAQEAGWGLTVTGVRYSYVDLVGFYERLSGNELPGGDACAFYGLDARANAIQFTLRRLDDEVVAYIRVRLPADAIRIIVQPRASRAVAL